MVDGMHPHTKGNIWRIGKKYSGKPGMREFIEEDRRDEIKTYFHGPMDWPKPPNLFFCLGTLNIPERVEKVPVVNWRRKMTHRRVLVNDADGS